MTIFLKTKTTRNNVAGYSIKSTNVYDCSDLTTSAIFLVS